MLRWSIGNQAPIIFAITEFNLPDLIECHSNVTGFTS